MRRLCILLLILTMVSPAVSIVQAAEIQVGGLMRVRLNVAGEFDGRNEWNSRQMAAAKGGGSPWLMGTGAPLSAGNYNCQNIYDRGTHFFAAGPGTNTLGRNNEDNPSAAGYWTPQNPGYFAPNSNSGFSWAGATFGGSPGAGGNTAIGPDLWTFAGMAGRGARGSQGLGDDEMVIADQRLDVYLTIELAECLRINSSFRAEGTWGIAGQGADWGADDIRVAVETWYLDFKIPYTPLSALVGVQTFFIHRGWLLNAQAPGLFLSAAIDPVVIDLIYIRAGERGAFEDRQDDIDIYGGSVSYATDRFSARGTILYQDGPSSTFTSADQAKVSAVEEFGNTIHWYALDLGYMSDLFQVQFTGVMNGGTNDYYRLDDRRADGSAKPLKLLVPIAADYNGYLLDAQADIYLGAVTLYLKGFYTSGDEFKDFGYDSNDDVFPSNQPGGGRPRNNFFFYQDADDSIDRTVYPGPLNTGVDTYWSEILGSGVFDQGNPGSGGFGQYGVGGNPYNVWALSLGAAYRLTDQTTLSATYWYINTSEDVVASVDENFGRTFGNVIAKDSSLGHEFDVYISQSLCAGLELRLVGAYLFSGGAVSIWDNDENMYEYGLRLQMEF